MEFLCFSLWPLSLFLLSGIYTCWETPPEPSLLLAEQSQLSQPFLTLQMPQSISHLCGLLLDLLQYVYVSLVLGIPKQDKVFQMWSHQGQVEAKITSSDLLEMLCPTAAQETADLLCLKGHIAGLHSAWYSPGSQVFSCSLNNKIVSYTIMKGSYAISSFK